MKIFSLLSCFDDKTKKSLTNLLAKELNNSQTILLKEIIKLDLDEFLNQKPKIYRKAFNKPYTDKMDGNLRNQISIIFNVLRKNSLKLWNSENQDNIIDTVSYLKEISRRFKTDFFQKEWNMYYSEYEKEQNYHALYLLNNLMYNFSLSNPKDTAKANEYLEKAIKYNLAYYEEGYQNILYSALTLNYAKKVYNLPQEWSAEKIRNVEKKSKDEFIVYTSLINDLMAEDNEEKKWIIAKRCIDIVGGNMESIKEIQLLTISKGLANYAIILSYENNNDRALEVMEFIYKNKLHELSKQYWSFYFNYSTVLLKQDRREESMYFLNKLEELDVPVHPMKLAQKDIRWVFIKLLRDDLDGVFDKMNTIQKDLDFDDQRLYLRLLYAFYFLQTEDFESFKRECENSKQSKLTETELSKDEAIILKWMSKLSKLTQLPKEESKTKILKLKETITESEFYKNSDHLLLKLVDKNLARLLT